MRARRDRLTTRSLQAIHSILRRCISRAQARDKVVRNAALVDTPERRKEGRPSKAMNLDQATAVVERAKGDPLHAYVVLTLMTGVRTEEARALRWSHVAWVPEANDWRPVPETGFRRKKYAVYVWRSVREEGDTKTEKSRRTLEIPDDVARAQGPSRRPGQAKAGSRQGVGGERPTSSSAPASARRSTWRTSAASPRLRAWGRGGRRASCVTRSFRS